MKIRFYDNDSGNFDGMKKYHNMELILVDDTTPNELIVRMSDRHFIKYYDSIDNIKQKRKLKELYELFPDLFERGIDKYNKTLEVSNGMTIDQVKELIAWSWNNRYDTCVVFFDWDRTLTIKEGIYLGYMPKHLKEEYLIYLFGGLKRYRLFKKLFRFFRYLGIKYYILTNNMGAIKNFKEFFNYIKFLDPHFTEDQMFASNLEKDTKDQSRKKIYLRKHQKIWKPNDMDKPTTTVKQGTIKHFMQQMIHQVQ
jgi:hypothetical protein